MSISWVSFAAGFNSNSSFGITQLYPYRICWFTRRVIYYFVTIPVGSFLVVNFITFAFVAKKIIDHVRHATSRHQTYERAKRCVLVLLSSCVTQGIAWLLGPFLTFAEPEAGNVLEWFFVILNGLEGVWSILLYIIIRSQRIYEEKRVRAAVELSKTTSITSVRDKAPEKLKVNKTVTDSRREANVIERRRRRNSFDSFTDLHQARNVDPPLHEESSTSL